MNPTKEQQNLVDKLEDVNERRWSTSWETKSSKRTCEDGDRISVPSHYKKYTVEDQKIVVKQPERLKVPKKNGKLRVCVNLKKVNASTIRDHYPLPISQTMC